MKTNEMKHTPGPWSFFEHCLHDPEEDNPMYVIGPREFSTVADVRPGSSDDGLPEQTIHNARLIAAAPELLELVQAALEWIDAVPSDTVLPAMPGFDRDWADYIISQATQENGGAE